MSDGVPSGLRALASVRLLLVSLLARAALAAGLLVAHDAARDAAPADRGTVAGWAADRTLVAVLLGSMVLEAAAHVAFTAWARRRAA